MADDIEINPTESVGENLDITPEIDASNEMLDSPEEVGGVESDPTDTEVLEIANEREDQIDREVDLALNDPNEPGNSYLLKLTENPTEAGENEFIEIERINDKIREAGDEARKDINEIVSDLENPSVEENGNNEETIEEDGGIVDGDWEFIDENTEEAEEVIEDVGEDSEMVQGEVVEEIIEDVGEEVLQSEEIVDGEWEFLDEDISPETEEFLIDNGLEDIAQGLSPEELEKFEEIKQLIADNFRQLSVSQNLNALGVTSILAGTEDESRVKEAIKVLLRVGVRMGTRIIAFIADEIVKSADKDDKGTKFLFGSIRDGVKGIESMSDTLITGKDKPERTTKAISDLLRGKAKRDK